MAIEFRLSCDVTPTMRHPAGDDDCDTEASYTGAQADEEAERDGWLWDIERNVCVCPDCAKAGVRPKDCEPQ